MRDATLVFTLAFTLACGGKAVIDGEPASGGGGSTATSMSAGGSPPGPTTGGGGSGGTPGCSFDGGFIDIVGDGPDQRFMAGGPGELEDVPTANLVSGGGPSPTASLEVRGCAGNNSTNLCIDMLGPALDDEGDRTSEARVEYTSGNGIVFIGDFVVMGLDILEPVGQEIVGFFDGEVFASGGADSRYLFGNFAVCRGDDRLIR